MNGYIPSRFISAKDDNESKVLVWGIMTDDHEYMHLSIRDFRPACACVAQVKSSRYSDNACGGLSKYVCDRV